MAFFGIFVAALLSIPASAFAAWAASTLWGWFVVPLGVVAVSTWHMWGLGLVASYFTMTIKREGPDIDGADFVEVVVVNTLTSYFTVAIWSAVALLIGVFLKEAM